MESIITFIESNKILVKVIIIILGYLLTFKITTFLINKIVLKNIESIDADGKVDQKDEKLIRDGYIIGKCENIIILSFILVNEVTGLALIFAAKSLAREKDINDNAGFFLAGTMVNFTATLIIAYCLKFLLNLL